MHIHFVFPSWTKLLEDHPELESTLSAFDLGNFKMAGLGIPAAAGALPPGHTASLVDENVCPVDYSVEADLIAISFFTPQAGRACSIAGKFADRGLPVIGGGIHPTAVPRESLDNFTSVVRGPVEGLWREILADLSGGALKKIYTGAADAPFAQPRRTLFEHSPYLQADIVQTARGCEVGCPFCVVPACYGSQVRLKPVEAVIEDLNSLRRCSFFFADENLLFADSGNRAYLEELLEAMISRRVRRFFFLASYPFIIRGVPGPLWRRLADAGCRQVYLVLGLQRPLTDELKDDDLKRKMALMKEAGIEAMSTFTLGHDSDPPAVENLILDFCEETRSNLVEFTIRTPFPGTAEYNDLSGQGRILTRDWSRYNAANVVFEPRGQSAESLREMYLRLWRRVYGGVSGFEMNKRYLQGFGKGIFGKS
ncbi:MAG: hypothetical protein R6V03_00315 [Kiritimatiellia bacterium]